jgi:hypothetical protein
VPERGLRFRSVMSTPCYDPVMPEWPDWWSWDLELSPHLLKRMVDRRFNEADLRLMLEEAAGYHSDIAPGRWVVESRRAGLPWEIIVEPLPDERILLVITAYSAR